MRSLTLFSLFKIALKHIFVLILAAVIAGSAAFSYCKYIATPKYSATGYVFVTNGAIIADENQQTNTDGNTNNSDIVASMNFINTIVDILNTNGIYKEMSEKLDNQYSYQMLDSMSSIYRKHENSLFLSVNFTTSDPNESIRLVNECLELIPDYIKKFVQNSATSTTPSVSASKIYPQTLTTTMITAVIGAGIVYFILLLIYAANILIQDEEDFKQRFDIPVIGSVPDFTSARTGKSRYSYYKYGGYNKSTQKKSKAANITQLNTGDNSQNKTPFSVVEAYKNIRVHLLSHLSSINGNVVVVSSPFASDGKSTTAINIAITLSHLSKKVLIIDADSRRSTLHKKLKITNELGCTDVISGEAKFEDVIKSYNSYLDVLTSGTIRPNPSELFVSSGFDALLNKVKEDYDYVIIDTPPINIVSDTLVISQKCDSLIIVARAGITTYEAFKSSLDTAKSLNINIMGAILNGTDNQQNKYYRYKYNKYYKKHGYYNYSK